MRIIRLAATRSVNLRYVHEPDGREDAIPVTYDINDKNFDLFAYGRRKLMEKHHWEKGWHYLRWEPK